jgi:hypothetical protein
VTALVYLFRQEVEVMSIRPQGHVFCAGPVILAAAIALTACGNGDGEGCSDSACNARCVDQGYPVGGYCSDQGECVCVPSPDADTTTDPDVAADDVPVETTDPDAEALPDIPLDDGVTPDTPVDPVPDLPSFPRYSGPIMIDASNYASMRAELMDMRPFMVYGWASDPALEHMSYESVIATLESIDDPMVEKMVMFSSYATFSSKINQAGHPEHLRSIGIAGFGYNTEGTITPTSELDNVTNPDPSVNPVARFAQLADEHGFYTIWGPIRYMTDSISNEALGAMFSSGLDGAALQEQNMISSFCAADRIAGVESTITRYRGIGGASIHMTVQIMSGQCLDGDTYADSSCPAETITDDYDHCMLFVEGIEPVIDSLAVWAMGPEVSAMPAFIRAIRGL